MILQGNQRGGGANLAQHLLKEENDHVHVHDLRGFVSSDLPGAFKEAYAASRATKAKQFLFSLSLNPPPSENVPTEVFEETITRVEHALGLAKQPRAIVFHEKDGRRHAHAVWSRIDAKEGKAVQLSFTKRKLVDLSRELFLEHGWRMPKGLMRSELRDPRNFTLAQWQQAQRQVRDPREIKQALQECWAASDTRAAFSNALHERGFLLAKGDRRGFVAVDFLGEVYSIAKWTNQKARDVRKKLGDANDLCSVEEAKAQWIDQHQERLAELRTQHTEKIRARFEMLAEKKRAMTTRHGAERQAQKVKQEEQNRAALIKCQAHFRRGLLGLFDRISGKRKRLEQEAEALAYAQAKTQQAERDELIYRQLADKRQLLARSERLLSFTRAQRRMLAQEFKDATEKPKDKEPTRPRRGRSPRPGR